MTIADLPAHLERLTAAHIELAEAHRQTRERLARITELEREIAALKDRDADLMAEVEQLRAQLRAVQARPLLDRQAIVAAMAEQIRNDPQLRELLRGPRGVPGVDGRQGPPGDTGATVIREVKISG